MTATATDAGRLLSVRGLVKRFGPTLALDGASFDLREREIHALVGCSGAGKTTLLDIVTGLDTCDGGDIVYRGFPISLRSRRDALRIGITVVAQRSTLVRDLTVFENIAMPHWGRPHRHEPPDLRKRVATVLSSFGWEKLGLDRPAAELSLADGRRVEIARAFVARAKLYVLDEPFSSLSARDIDSLLGVMMRLRLAGCGIVVAGSRLDDLVSVADRVTVLRDGRTAIDAVLPGQGDQAHLRRAMGLPAEAPPPPRAAPIAGAAALTVRRLEALPDVHAVSFTAGAGEIVGLYGLRGSGRSAALMALGGLQPRSNGVVEVRGEAVWSTDAHGLRRAGIAILGAHDRPLMPHASARSNLRLVAPADRSGWPIDALWRSLDLPSGGLDVPVAAQPSGVRRRIALAGALAGAPAVLLLEDPCAGLDAAARTAVQATLREAASRRLALVVTGDLDGIRAVADRIVVLRDGRSVAELPAALADEEALTLLATPGDALARNTKVLTDLTRENGGAAFWAIRREDHVVCLNAVVADAVSDPGLRAGRAMPLADTRIPQALRGCEEAFVTEADGVRSTLLVPIHTRRGRAVGLIGVTLQARGRALPPASALVFRIDSLAATL